VFLYFCFYYPEYGLDKLREKGAAGSTAAVHTTGRQ
jgi:hypothetical protein